MVDGLAVKTDHKKGAQWAVQSVARRAGHLGEQLVDHLGLNLVVL